MAVDGLASPSPYPTYPTPHPLIPYISVNCGGQSGNHNPSGPAEEKFSLSLLSQQGKW